MGGGFTDNSIRPVLSEDLMGENTPMSSKQICFQTDLQNVFESLAVRGVDSRVCVPLIRKQGFATEFVVSLPGLRGRAEGFVYIID
jgi:hypothetical protein